MLVPIIVDTSGALGEKWRRGKRRRRGVCGLSDFRRRTKRPISFSFKVSSLKTQALRRIATVRRMRKFALSAKVSLSSRQARFRNQASLITSLICVQPSRAIGLVHCS